MKMDKTDFSSNKEDNELYFDTCASNHFVNHVPEIFDSSKIGTVNGSTAYIYRVNFPLKSQAIGVVF
jgi:hypothetical protein